MKTGQCHCGAIRVSVPRKPRQLTSCNCSICRRYGALWAYYRPDSVRIADRTGALEYYAWDGKRLKFGRCRHCGCVTHWAPVRRRYGRMGVNARMFDPDVLAGVRIRRLDGAATWRYLD